MSFAELGRFFRGGMNLPCPVLPGPPVFQVSPVNTAPRLASPEVLGQIVADVSGEVLVGEQPCD
jgi:hypothetical protein